MSQIPTGDGRQHPPARVGGGSVGRLRDPSTGGVSVTMPRTVVVLVLAAAMLAQASVSIATETSAGYESVTSDQRVAASAAGGGLGPVADLADESGLTSWSVAQSGQGSASGGSFTQVSAGGDHSCGLRSDGAITCWGNNEEGQLDAPSGSFTQVSAGGIHSCGLRSDGKIACWGNNFFGQSDAPSGSFTQVSAGTGGHSCGLRSDGKIACWGNILVDLSDAPSGSFTQVAAGGGHSCGLRSDGKIACWGSNENGQSDAPSGSFTQVAAGGGHSCGLRSDGTVTCWGSNENGQSDAPSDSFTTQVSAGFWHSCLLRSDGAITCWGYDVFGQLDAPSGSFTQVAAGGFHSCGLRSDGAITCWGALAFSTAAGSAEGGGPSDEGTVSEDAGVHQPSIDALSQHVPGLFDGTGCGRGLCPGEALQRWEMAVWLVRVLDGANPSPLAFTRFADVEYSLWWAAYVDRLAELGVTKGCATGPLRFCPDRAVTRAQMATFLVRAFSLEAAPSAGFADTAGTTHQADIDALAAAGMTVGCKTDPLRFCPGRSVTRGQMATFLARALGIV